MAKSFLLEGGAQIYAEQIFKRLKADRKLARRWQTQMRTTETSKNATQHKHAREGTQCDRSKMNIEVIISQTQRARHFSCLADYKGQQGLPRQNGGT
jgi:hypothetical protein